MSLLSLEFVHCRSYLYILECTCTCSPLIWLLRIRTRNCCGNFCLSYSFEFVPFRTSSLDNLECKWTSIPMIFYIRIRTRHFCCNIRLSYFFEFVDCGVSSLIIVGRKSISGPLIWYLLARKRNWWSNGFLIFSIAALLPLLFKCVSSLVVILNHEKDLLLQLMSILYVCMYVFFHCCPSSPDIWVRKCSSRLLIWQWRIRTRNCCFNDDFLMRSCFSNIFYLLLLI